MLQVNNANRVRYYASCPESELIKLPATKEAIISHINMGCIGYSYCLEDFSDCLSTFESVAELNYLAALINDLQIWEYVYSWKLDRFYAAIQFGKHTGSAKDLINLVQNLDCYMLYEDVMDEEEFGHFYGEELGWLDIDEEEEDSFDFEAYGQELCLALDGKFIDDGYIVYEGGFVEYYRGQDDLPDEYKILTTQAEGEMPV